jgi:transposase
VAHPEIPLDNNRAENAVRGPVVGRKNYYGSGSIWSAQFTASMFTALLTLDQVWGIHTRLWLTEFLQAYAAERGAAAGSVVLSAMSRDIAATGPFRRSAAGHD